TQPAIVTLTPAAPFGVDPVPQGRVVDAQLPGHLRDRLARLPDQPDRALLEVLLELPACLCHRHLPFKAMSPRYEGKPTRHALQCGHPRVFTGTRPLRSSPSLTEPVGDTSESSWGRRPGSSAGYTPARSQ